MNISKIQYSKLEWLKQKATMLQKELDMIVKQAEHITKDTEEFTFDFIMNDFQTLDELLSGLGIDINETTQ